MRAALLVEALSVYLLAPLVMEQLVARGLRYALLPGMWVIAGLLVWQCSALVASFGARAWQMPPAHARLGFGVRMTFGVGGLALLSRWVAPESFLVLPRNQPLLWLAVAIFVSVAQRRPSRVHLSRSVVATIRSRAGGRRGMSHSLVFGLGVLAFAFAHVIFRNPVAIVVTTAGGVLFLNTYRATGSLLLSNLEHALLGVSAFSFGLGKFLYLGAARAV